MADMLAKVAMSAGWTPYSRLPRTPVVAMATASPTTCRDVGPSTRRELQAKCLAAIFVRRAGDPGAMLAEEALELRGRQSGP